MNYRLEFEIPGLTKTPNNLLGAPWKVRCGHKRRWLAAVMKAIGPRAPRVPLQTARLTLTRFSSVEPDHDGLSGSFKAIIDSLKNCGIIADDRPANIGTPTYLWEKCGPKHGKIRVVVEAISEAAI